PADQPGDELAEHGVAVRVRAAGDWYQSGKLRVAKRRRGARDAGDQERDRDGRTRIDRRLLPGQHEHADADDAADADRRELPDAEYTAEVVALADLALQLFDRLVAR